MNVKVGLPVRELRHPVMKMLAGLPGKGIPPTPKGTAPGKPKGVTPLTEGKKG